jgi:hypothetical protein
VNAIEEGFGRKEGFFVFVLGLEIGTLKLK